MKRHELKFINPTWHYGINSTVRMGMKWANLVELGDEVAIVRTGNESKVLAFGRIIAVNTCNFWEVPIQTLFYEHDRECSNYSGLCYAMLRAYPEFNLESFVTVLYFEIN